MESIQHACAAPPQGGVFRQQGRVARAKVCAQEVSHADRLALVCREEGSIQGHVANASARHIEARELFGVERVRRRAAA